MDKERRGLPAGDVPSPDTIKSAAGMQKNWLGGSRLRAGGMKARVRNGCVICAEDVSFSVLGFPARHPPVSWVTATAGIPTLESK